MKDNRDMHPADDIQNRNVPDNMSNHNITEITEKNVTNMKASNNAGSTEDQQMNCEIVMRHLLDYSDSMAGRDMAFEDGEPFDMRLIERMEEHGEECEECRALIEQERLLDELLNEIAREDAQVIAPLEAQAAWRKAIRAEAAAQIEGKTVGHKEANEERSEKSSSASKIIRLNRWMRSVGSVAAALVVLIAGTYGVRMGDSALPSSQKDQAALYAYNETAQNQNLNGYSEQGGDRDIGMGVSSGGYVLTGTYLRSDGADDHQTTQQGQKQDTTEGQDTLQQSSQETNEQGKAQATSNTAADVQTGKIEPVVLRSAERSIVSQDYDRDVQWLGDLMSEYDAYYEEKTETAAVDEQTGRVCSMVIRVPSERLNDFLMEMDQLGTTVMRRETAEDVTGRYMDSQSRLNALQLQKDKLSEMVEGAQSVQELIAIDAQLTEVISEMERIEGDLRRWQSQQSYSTVTITLSEVFEQPLTSEASIGERMKAGFSESVNWLDDFGQDALVVLVSVLPRLVVWVPAIVLIGVVIWAFTRRKKH